MIPFFSPTREPDPALLLDCLEDHGLPRDDTLIVGIAGDGLALNDEGGPLWPFLILLTERGGWMLADQEDHR